MLEAAAIIFRLLQYSGATILLGSSLFFLYGLPRTGEGSAAAARWTRALLVCTAGLLALATAGAIVAQASLLAGSVSEGLKPATWLALVSAMDLGKAAVVRLGTAVAAMLLLMLLKPGRGAWWAAVLLGALATATFPWMGHGAATEGVLGQVHLISDILHSWAASVWIGALVAFFILLRARDSAAADLTVLHRSLHGFSGVGSLLVAILVATGLVNSWILVGPDRLGSLLGTPYGLLLSAKLTLFAAMLGLAAANRFRHTPALHVALGDADASSRALPALRRSIVIETAIGFAVLALVAWFGTLSPPSAS
jgi:putative copper resistance protein D